MVGVASSLVRWVFVLFFFFSIPDLVFAAAGGCDPPAAKAVSVQGAVECKPAGASQWQPVHLDDTFCPGDEVRVLDNSRAGLALPNDSVLRLRSNSSIVVQGFKDQKTSLVDMLKGAAHFFSRRPNSLDVRTPFVVAGVRGTEFLVRVEDDRTFLSIFEGGVLASNDAGEVTLAGGQAAIAERGKAPVLTTVVRPRDAVQWALYYPPVIYTPPDQATMAGPADDPGLLAVRAANSLVVGNIAAAEADLDRALSLDPRFSGALALKSIVALVKNEKERAYSLADQAVAADPRSSAAHTAMSYARQAGFDLEGARHSLMQAVAAAPGDALAQARLAEIQLSFGELDKALQSAEKAATLASGLSRTQTVLGFAYLTQVKTDEARAAFDKAIRADQADPLPRLGLGLAKIRDGQLQEGRKEIEVAAGLDPNNSLIRSYLGKAYYEEKRNGLDQREYAIAKELDPNDPTPYFYDAIAKQTTNRPVEALQDLQKAIELNDNRAVYRSKLLLDSDLAARSASQARIYSDLGFQQRALAEGYDAVTTDPTNYSAHRFLADSYSVLPRHEIARVSELLQSQLLQPSNMTPIQPGLAESNLFLISEGGTASTSFNEFNPLFNRNRIGFQASGLTASNDTWGGEGIVSGIYDKLSMSAGYSRFETDGYRENNDQNDITANIFAQFELSHRTSIQAEYRRRDTESGDLQQRFFQDDFLADLRKEDAIDTFRIGGRHAFAPHSMLLANFAYQDGDRDENDIPVPGELRYDLNGDDEAYSGEICYLHTSEYLKFVTGAGYFDIDRKDQFRYVLTPPPIEIPLPPPLPPMIIEVPPSVFDPLYDSDINHTNLYAYLYWEPVKRLTITIGASGDFYEEDTDVTVASTGDEEKLNIDENQLNPKFGISWIPSAGTTIRGAAFRTFKRTLITDQTLEPTQVAGFNQFFDDDNGTEAWVYGGGIDQKFSNNLFGGVQYTYRDLQFPYVSINTPNSTIEEVEWDEHFVRAYLYWAPLSFMSFSVEYLNENLDRYRRNTEGAKELRTQFLPLAVHFFHSSGVSATIKGTFVTQEGKFERRDDAGVFVDDDDSFWTVDAALSYRLPKRYGIVSVGATNLFDEEFRFYDSDRDNPRLTPERSVFCKLTLSF